MEYLLLIFRITSIIIVVMMITAHIGEHIIELELLLIIAGFAFLIGAFCIRSIYLTKHGK
jgi:hypothetical protein